MATDKTAARRHYSAEFKAQVLGECAALGASVAKVAMLHGVNANIVHGWRKLARETGRCNTASASASGLVQTQTQFLPVMLAAAAPQTVATSAAALPPSPPSSIQVEVRRGAVTMKLTWPACATADFAAWTREVLR